MQKNQSKNKLAIYIPNRKVNKEYNELFPLKELSKEFDLVFIYGEVVFDCSVNYKQARFPNLLRTFHALLHYNLMWYRKFTTLSYSHRAYQYFGLKAQVESTSNWLIYSGRRHNILFRLLVYCFGNYLGVKTLHFMLKIFFKLLIKKLDNLFPQDIYALILPYGGGISLEFDFFAYACRMRGIKTLAIQENWDNLSSKSFLLEHPSHFLTWSAQSTSHLRSFQRFTGYTKEIGSLRLNCFYEHRNKHIDRKKNYTFTTSDKKNVKILIIGTGPANHDLKTIEVILESLKSLDLNFEIVYRPHPFSQIEKSDLDTILRIENISVDNPMDNEKNEYRMNLILDSTIVISLFSTVLLEASILDKPSLIPSFIVTDVGYKTHFFLDDFTHYSGMSILKNIHNARSKEEFLKILIDVFNLEKQLPSSQEILGWFCKNTNTKDAILEEIHKLQ